MHEREARMAVGQLLPETPDPELALADVDVVEEDDGAIAELGLPGLEVVGTASQVWRPSMWRRSTDPSAKWERASSKVERTSREKRPYRESW
jgi:hypothetical protein